MMLFEFFKKRESILPLAVLSIVFYGVFDAATTIYTAGVIQASGIPNPYHYEISPLVTSGLFGSGHAAVILTKVAVLSASLVIIWIASRKPQLALSSNVMLMGSIVAGLLAGSSNLYLAFAGENFEVFGVSSAFATLVVAAAFEIYGLLALWRSAKTVEPGHISAK